MVKLSLRDRVVRRIARARGQPSPIVLTAKVLPEYRIGIYTYGAPIVHDYPRSARLTIGAYCSIAAEVDIFLGGEHHPEWVTTYPFGAVWPEHDHLDQPKTRGDVRIGHDVWIGRGATIMSGVTIGDGAVIGARALIAKDVAPYMIVVGNPAKPLRTRFSAEQIERLLEIRWWDWPEDRVRRAAGMLQAPDIDGFIQAVDEGRA